MPVPGAPRRSPGVASKLRSAVEDELRPSFSSSRVTAKPCAPRRTTKALGLSGSRAKTRKLWACEPFVVHCLVPLRRPSASARVRMAPASDPEPDSVRAKAAIS